ncbi:unnamed protein product [Gadus morhua 'NCC']
MASGGAEQSCWEEHVAWVTMVTNPTILDIMRFICGWISQTRDSTVDPGASVVWLNGLVTPSSNPDDQNHLLKRKPRDFPELQRQADRAEPGEEGQD